MPKTTTKTFWARLKEALVDAKLPTTQTWVAEKLGMSQSSVTEWNKPAGYPTIENTVELAKLARVNVEWLLTERGPKRPLPQDALAQELWDMWPHLDDATKGRLVGIASGRLRPSQDDAPQGYQRLGGNP